MSPKKRTFTETNPDGTLILDFQPPGLWKIKSVFKPPRLCMLLRQLWQTEIFPKQHHTKASQNLFFYKVKFRIRKQVELWSSIYPRLYLHPFTYSTLSKDKLILHLAMPNLKNYLILSEFLNIRMESPYTDGPSLKLRMLFKTFPFAYAPYPTGHCVCPLSGLCHMHYALTGHSRCLGIIYCWNQSLFNTLTFPKSFLHISSPMGLSISLFQILTCTYLSHVINTFTGLSIPLGCTLFAEGKVHRKTWRPQKETVYSGISSP